MGESTGIFATHASHSAYPPTLAGAEKSPARHVLSFLPKDVAGMTEMVSSAYARIDWKTALDLEGAGV